MKAADDSNALFFVISPDGDWCENAANAWPCGLLPAIRAALVQEDMLMDEYDYFVGTNPDEWVLAAGVQIEDSKVHLDISVEKQHACRLLVYQLERPSQPTQD